MLAAALTALAACSGSGPAADAGLPDGSPLPDLSSGDDAAEAGPGPGCSFTSPTCAPCQNPVTFALAVTGPVVKVRYMADGTYELGTSTDAASGFALTYTFSQPGQRQITAHLLGAGEQVLAQCARSVEVTPGYPAVPYFYQYDNTLQPGTSCQNTSLAMVLAHYGFAGKPDDITGTWGTQKAQSPAGLAEVFNTEAQTLGIPQRLTAHTNGQVQDVRTLLAAGKPVIIHGYFTSYGHVVVTLGFDGTHYVVHDPAGQWSEVFKGGYTGPQSPTAGKAVRYTAAAFEAAVATSDGSTFLPIWYHELTP